MNKSCWLLPGLILGAAGALANERAGADEASYALPEIVVTARNLQGSTNLERKVDLATIQAWNAHTAAEILVQTPGVNVQYGGSSGDARIWMRGFRDRDILILFDGIPIASALEGNIDLNEISAVDVGEVRVTKSAPSVIYGPNAMGGVVDVVPQAERWQDGFTLGLEAGEHDRRRVNAAYTGNADGFLYRLGGSHDERDSFALSDDFTDSVNQQGSKRTNADFRRQNLFAYARADTRSLGQTSFFYNQSTNERGLAPEVGEVDADFERLSQSDRRTVALSNQFETVPLSVKVFHNHYDSELQIFTDNTYQVLDEVEDAEEDTYGAMLYSSIGAGDHHVLVFGASAIRERFESEGALENFDHATLRTYALAVEDHISLGSVTAVVGALVSRFEQPQDNRSLDTFNPQLTLDWRINDNITLHGSAAQRTRFPKLRELYQRRRGNPDLSEQVTYNYQLGVAYHNASGWFADVTAFRSDVDDLIERPDRRSSYQNLPEVTFEGVEAAAGGWVHERVYARLAYTYLDAAERLDGGRERQIRSRARHSVYGELRVTLDAGFSLAANAVYSDGLYDLDGEQNHVELPDYVSLHLKAAKSFTDKLDGYISVANFTDEDYMHRLGYPRPGREIRVGMTLRI